MSGLTPVEKAAERGDVRELVRLAWVHPSTARQVDAALVRLLDDPQEGPSPDHLAAVLTMPLTEPDWDAAAVAVRRLSEAGADGASVAWSVAAQGHYPAKMRAADVLEAVGDVQGAMRLRGYGASSGRKVVRSSEGAVLPEPVGFGGWLIFFMIPLFTGPLSLLAGYLGYLGGSSIWRPSAVSSYLNALPAPLAWTILAHATNLMAFAFAIWLVYLALKKRRLFARLVVWYIPFTTLTDIPYYVGRIMSSPRLAMSVMTVVDALVIVAIWMLYYRRSRRVRNTFVN